MNTTILFPGDYFSLNSPTDNFAAEREAALACDGLEPALFNYDEYIQGEDLVLNKPASALPKQLLYRGWMIKPDQYARFYHDLVKLGFEPIVLPAEYGRMHCFPSAAKSFANQTPTYRVFPQTDGEVHLDAHTINETFQRFMMKDYVKSLKGTSFPACIETPVTQEELDELVRTFVQLRGELFTGGIVIKAYVNLKRYSEATNEWRMFVLHGRVLGMCRNSNQPTTTPAPPQLLTEAYTSLDSPFYTLDFAELEDGSWTIVEAGDGQVSGLAAADYPTRFYEQLACINAENNAEIK